MNTSNVRVKREGTFTETKHMRNALKLKSVILENNCLENPLKHETATMTVLLPRFIFGSCHTESKDNKWLGVIFKQQSRGNTLAATLFVRWSL